eukprot:jgi/Tetstr1/443160/TSEL_031200.t1
MSASRTSGAGGAGGGGGVWAWAWAWILAKCGSAPARAAGRHRGGNHAGRQRQRPMSTKGPEALAATRWLFAERLAKEVPSAGPRDLIVMALEEKDDNGYVFDPATSICNEELRPGSEFNNKYLQARFRVVPGTQAEYDRIKNYVATSAIVDDVLGRRGACASVAAIERDEIKLKPRCGGTRDGFNSDADIPQREQASATEVRGVDSQDERVANAGAPAADANVRSSINRPDDDDFAFGW